MDGWRMTCGQVTMVIQVKLDDMLTWTDGKGPRPRGATGGTSRLDMGGVAETKIGGRIEGRWR